MVVRFLAGVSFLLALVLVPALVRLQLEDADAATTVVAVASHIEERPTGSGEIDATTDDAVTSLAAAFTLVWGGRRDELVAADPDYARRLLKWLATSKGGAHRGLASAVLLGLGDAARGAALELSLFGSDAEREVAREALEILGGRHLVQRLCGPDGSQES